jgi:ADP-ribose pyrophosphatase YjhB (NUDIX family)
MPLFGKPAGGAKFEPPTEPHHWVNSDGLGLRLQCFLVVRDAERRIACVRLKGNPQQWMLPGESMRPNEAPDDAARRVAEMWFGTPLPAQLADIQSYPDDGDQRWYLLFVYEAKAPPAGLPKLDDTEQVAFVPAGKAPGEFAMDHGAVFGRLR